MLFVFFFGFSGVGSGTYLAEQAVRFIVAAPPTLDCRSKASLVSKLDQPAAPPMSLL